MPSPSHGHLGVLCLVVWSSRFLNVIPDLRPLLDLFSIHKAFYGALGKEGTSALSVARPSMGISQDREGSVNPRKES
ncbi:MAG TPA: hypothetical protein DD856_09800 [Sulfobacillus sp.]|nr:hypothetical protein [Sulfobacillus sp.]